MSKTERRPRLNAARKLELCLATRSADAPLGEIVSGRKPGRRSAVEITLFKSVSVAVQDVAAAGAILETAERLGLDTEVAL